VNTFILTRDRDREMDVRRDTLKAVPRTKQCALNYCHRTHRDGDVINVMCFVKFVCALESRVAKGTLIVNLDDEGQQHRRNSKTVV